MVNLLEEDLLLLEIQLDTRLVLLPVSDVSGEPVDARYRPVFVVHRAAPVVKPANGAIRPNDAVFHVHALTLGHARPLPKHFLPVIRVNDLQAQPRTLVELVDRAAVELLCGRVNVEHGLSIA